MTKYLLTVNQNKELNNVWKFILYFSNPKGISKNWWEKNGKMFGVYEYRKYIINMIKKNISENDFYQYEKIINKLYWNLKYALMPYVKNNKSKYKIHSNKEVLEIKSGSYINSYLQYNEKDNKWYFVKNLSKLDIICMNIMRDRKKYLYYLKNPSSIEDYSKKNDLDTYYYLNYAFPNVNPLFYNKNSKSYWMKKIHLMYYEKDDKNWYKLIVPNSLVNKLKRLSSV